MPGKVKVKIIACRNLPVMDRGSDTTDAYVEIKLGSITQKTDVKRKTLNPQFNSDWFRFEVDDADMQDEPLQIRIMDYDTYSANDQIGKVCINLNPLLLTNTDKGGPISHTGKGSVMSGWLPVYDTMLGIRGEINLIVKVDLFSDVNKFRQSSCGVQFFHSPNIPYGYHAQIIHGFVEELVVNDDPEYQWIDKIRRASASNEARQVAFLKLSGQVQRKIGLKAIDLGANAVIGYTQCFDLEGEMIIVRGIGTAVTLVKMYDLQSLNQNISVNDNALLEENRLRYYEFLACGNQTMLEQIKNKSKSNRVEEALTFSEILANSDVASSSNKNIKFLVEHDEMMSEEYNPKKRIGIKVLKKFNPFKTSAIDSDGQIKRAALYQSLTDLRNFIRRKSSGATKFTRSKSDGSALTAILAATMLTTASDSALKTKKEQTKKVGFDESHKKDTLMCFPLKENDPSISNISIATNADMSSSSDDDNDDDDDDDEDDVETDSFNPKLDPETVSMVIKNVLAAEEVKLNQIKATASEKSAETVKVERINNYTKEKPEIVESSLKDSLSVPVNKGAIPKIAEGPEVPNLIQIDDDNLILKDEKANGTNLTEKQKAKEGVETTWSPDAPKHKHDFIHDLRHKISDKLHYLHDHIHLPHLKHNKDGSMKHHKQPGLLETALESILLDKINIMEAHSGITPKTDDENLEHLEKANIELEIETVSDKIHSIQEQIHLPHLPDGHHLKEKIHHLQEHIHFPHFERNSLHKYDNDGKLSNKLEKRRSLSEIDLSNKKIELTPLKSILSEESFLKNITKFQDSNDWKNSKASSLDSGAIEMNIDKHRDLDESRKQVTSGEKALLEHILDDFKRESLVRVNTLPKLEAKGQPISPIGTFLQSKCLSIELQDDEDTSENDNDIQMKSDIRNQIMGKSERGFRLQKLSEISRELSNDEPDESIPEEVREIIKQKSEYEPKCDLKPAIVLEETINISSANQIKISVLRTPSFKRKSFSDEDLVFSDKLNRNKKNINDNNTLSVTNKLPLHESLLSLKHRNELSASPSGTNRAGHSRTESIGCKVSQSPAKLSGTPGSLTGRDIICRRSSDSDLSITPKGNSLTSGDRTTGVPGYVRVPMSALMKQPLNQENLEMLEYPFLTLSKVPQGFIIHIGATVAARSVKLLERVPNLDEPETRDSWWNELRMEIRSHCRSLGCNVVLGYRESTTITDDVCVLSATGTACVINLHFTTEVPSYNETGQRILKTQTTTIYNPKDLMTSSLDRQEFEPTIPTPKVSTVDAPPKIVSENDGEANGNDIPGKGKNTPEPLNNSAGSTGFISAPPSLCTICHVPYKTSSIFPSTLKKCNICKRGYVPDVLICSIEMPEGLQVTGRGCLIQAHVCRPKRDLRSESNAKEISDGLPFLEYELHRLLINKLKVKGMNAIFGLKAKVTVGEKMMALIATGTAIYLSALPPPTVPKVVAGNSWNDPERLAEIQKKIQDEVERNREIYQLKNYQLELESNGNKAKNISDTDDSDEENENLDYTVGNKEMCLLEVDDIEDLEVVSMLMEGRPPDGFHVVNTQSVPGLHDLEIVRNLQMFTQVWRAKVQTHQANSNFSKHFQRLLQTIYFKLRTMVPCAICDISFQLDLPENDEIQLLVTGMALGLGEPQRANKFKRKIVHSISRDKKLDDDLIFSLEEDNVGESKEEQGNLHVSAAGTPLSNITSPHFNQSGSLKYRRNTPTRTRFNSMKFANRHTPMSDRYGVDLSVLSYVAGGRIEKYLGNLNFFFIRESTSVRENGGICGFVHSFITELLAIVRAHVTALGGNAMISFYMTELILVDNPHKNQAQCLVNVGGDVVFVTYFNDE